MLVDVRPSLNSGCGLHRYGQVEAHKGQASRTFIWHRVRLRGGKMNLSSSIYKAMIDWSPRCHMLYLMLMQVN